MATFTAAEVDVEVSDGEKKSKDHEATDEVGGADSN